MPFSPKRVWSISVLAGILLCLAGPASAATVHVYCSGSTPPNPLPPDTYLTLNDGLNALASDSFQPNTLILHGTCHNESVQIMGFNRLTIQGAAGETAVISHDQVPCDIQATGFANTPVLRIIDSHQLSFRIIPNSGGTLTIRGGTGINIEDSSVTFSGVTVESSHGTGINLMNASTVSLNGRMGPNLTPNLVQDHCGNGINVTPGSSANLNNGNTVQNNQGIGINAGGNVNLNATSDSSGQILIQNNQRPGLNLPIGSSTVGMGGQVIIQNNSLNTSPTPFRGGIVVTSGFVGINAGGVQIIGNNGPGIWADMQGKVRLGPPLNATPSDFTISGNTEEGVRILHMSVVWSNGGTTTGNGVADVTCDGTSLLFGNVTGFAVNKCANTEVTKKK